LPEKLIVIKTGNIPNLLLLKIFEDNLQLIIEMLSRSNLVEISKTDIAEHG
jgi:predicted nuclease of predicted toxin-antitoxin system